MNQKRNFITSLHKSTARNYLGRMINQKVKCMSIAKKYSYDYWDGNRKYGYGGYSYIPGRWKNVARKLIKDYNLKKGSKILDLGCGKSFLLYEMLLIEPELKIFADDVKCSHGSTIGPVDESALFYLRSRGINKNEALKMILSSFIQDDLENLGDTNIKKINKCLSNYLVSI